MKHTMKKLLCMAMAIMLLVSAVPVFAAAAANDVNPNVSVKVVSSAGTTVVAPEQRRSLDSTQTVGSVLDGLYTYDSTRYTVTYKWNDGTYGEDRLSDQITDHCDSLEFTLTKRTVPVTIALDGVGSAQKNYEVDTTLPLNTDLLNTFNLQLTAGKVVDRWTVNGGQESISSYTITPADADRGYVTLSCYQKATSSPVTPPASNVTLTVNYTGDRSGTVTLSVPANTNVTATDVANAIKSQLGVSSLSISGFPTVTVTENTTIGGVKVSGINAVNYVLTIKVSGDYTGTASKTVPAGTSVTEADVKAAVKSALGITDNFNVDVPGAPIVMNCSQTVYVNATKITGSSSSSTNKFPYDVYLNIYKDTLVGSADKSVKITNGIALDGLVTLPEVKNVVKNYYTAKDSDGISYDGLYLARGNWVANYVADTEKYDSIKAGEMQQTGTVYINVMIGNAKAKSSSTADSSNPKTGDTIFVPVMVLGLTASALAAAYVIGKKRIAR